MKKGSILVLEFLIRLIIAVVLVAIIISIASTCIGNTSEAKASFEELVEKVNTIKEGELISMSLDMDKDTMIVLFNKDSNELRFKKLEQSWEDGSYSPAEEVYAKITEDKPYYPDKNSICLYLELPKSTDGSIDQFFSGKKVCKRTTVNLFYRGGFNGHITWNGASGGSGDYITEGGIMLARPARLKPVGWEPDRSEGELSNTERLKTVYIENYRGAVAICAWQPCLTAENKKEIDDMLNPIISN